MQISLQLAERHLDCPKLIYNLLNCLVLYGRDDKQTIGTIVSPRGRVLVL